MSYPALLLRQQSRMPLRLRAYTRIWRPLTAKQLGLFAFLAAAPSFAQSPAIDPAAMARQVEQLASAVRQQQEQLEQSLLQISLLQQQVASLQAQLRASSEGGEQSLPTGGQSDTAAAALASQVQALREQQQIHGSELATHEQTKVETESKFPLTLTGLLLANAFHNTGGVDAIATPTLAAAGSATTGVSLSQTILGLDARGPHVFSAPTHADVRVDFFGASSAGFSNSYGGYSAGLLRLRTAHVTADWSRALVFVELDRPIFSPNTPTSLTAIAQPALAWSGNLWTWLPQIGGAYRHSLGSASSLTLEAALMDVPNPPGVNSTSTSLAASNFSEQSEWPGTEVHLAYARGDAESGLRLGAGGYYSPHAAAGFFHFNAWAATLDYRVPLSRHLEATGAVYRGLALGGLGGGAYKDFVYTLSPSGAYQFVRPLDDVGGWSQIKARLNRHLEWNAAFGLDNAFASELRPYASATAGAYNDLVRNSTFFTNAIYSPTAYTSVSFEYRRLNSTPVTGIAAAVDVYGLAIGYKF